MKIKLKRDPLIGKAFKRIRAAHPDGLPPSPELLKRCVSLIDIIAFNLEQDPEWVDDNKAMFHCFHPESHSNGDARASMWAYNSYKGGAGRWGCPIDCAEGDDVFGFLMTLHNYSMVEAIRWVTVWRNNHSGRIGVRVRRGVR